MLLPLILVISFTRTGYGMTIADTFNGTRVLFQALNKSFSDLSNGHIELPPEEGDILKKTYPLLQRAIKQQKVEKPEEAEELHK